ncbi:uncharacterized protein [Aquarana catesbeiana]
MTNSQRLDKKMKRMTESILNLALEMILLLTGEDYKLVKKTSGDHVTPNSHPRKSRETSSSVIIEPPPPYLTCERNDKKILEVTQKIIELLTGEVPIRCQDVTVYFSMEEWEYLEGHKDLYKDIMMENRPSCTSPDGSSNRNTPERSLSPLYSHGSTQEHHIIPLDQDENRITIKTEVEEEAEDPYMMGDEPYMMGDEPCKEEEIPPEISTGIQHNRNDLRKLPFIYGEGEVEDNITIDFSEEDPSALYLYCEDLSSDSFTPGGNFPDPSSPMTSYNMGPPVRFPYFKHEEDDQRAELLLLQRSYMREQTFSCLESGGGFTPMASLIGHESLHAGPKPYPCFECGKTFSRKANLITHKKSHTGEKPFSCLECGERFTRKSSLMSHESLHTGQKQYACTECGKCFSRKANLITHEKSHTGEKPFSCTECGEQFTRKSSLMMHEGLHTGTRPYICSDCGKCFSRKANLIMHKKIHTGEKPFSCLECGERFTRKSSLNRHQIVHTGIRPFSCSECGETFNRSSSLIRHRKVHTVKLYSCLECGKCFKLRSHLMYHRQSYASKPYSCSELNQGVTGTVISF